LNPQHHVENQVPVIVTPVDKLGAGVRALAWDVVDFETLFLLELLLLFCFLFFGGRTEVASEAEK
jgi:hypothetical protein